MIKSFFLTCLFLLSGRLIAQAPTGNFTSHTNGQSVTNASINIKWKGCSNGTQTNYVTKINGTTLTTNQSNSSACPDYSTGKNYTASGTLAAGPNTLLLSLCAGGVCGQNSITVIYTAPAISVTPDGAAAPSVSVNETGSFAFKVKNTGGQAGTASVSVSCTSFLTSCSVTPTSTSLAVGDSVTVTASYTGSDDGLGRITVSGTYSQFPTTTDNGYADAMVIRKPTANFTSPSNGLTVTNSNITITWKGCSNATQTSPQTQLNGVGVATTQSDASACPNYSIGKNYSASGTLVSGANALFISVCDIDGCGDKTITVNYSPPSVNVTPDGGTATSIAIGVQGSAVFKVKNTGLQSATAALSVGCTAQLNSCSVSPASASISGGDSTAVTVSYTGDQIGTGRATLTASYNEFPGISDNGFVDVLVNQLPSATFTSLTNGQTVTSANITVSWKGCSNAAQDSYQTRLNGAAVTTTQVNSFTCPDYLVGKNYTASGTLTSGPNSLYIKVCDVSGCGERSITVNYAPPAPLVDFTSPTQGQVLSTASVSISWKGCSNGAPTSYQTTLNSASLVTTEASASACPEYAIGKNYSATATLSSGANTIAISQCDASGCGQKSITVTYAAPAVSVTPDGATASSIQVGSAGSFQFKAKNIGAQTATGVFSANCTAQLSSCSVSPTSAALAVGDSVAVTVSYEGASTGSGRATLTATYSQFSGISDTGYVNVTVSEPADPPTAQFTSHTDGQVVTSNEITVTWKGCSFGEQGGSFSLNGNSILAASDGDATCAGYPIGKTYSASITLVAGANTLVAGICDANGCAQKTITVNYGAPSGSITVALRNPGATIDKAGCLTVATGQNAAYECGDLRVVHALPATVTMDRTRAPALIYNSRHADPLSLIAVDVAVTGNVTGLRATVSMNGVDAVTDLAWNAACGSAACRVVIPVSATQVTGIYPVTLTIAAMSGGTTLATSSTLTDTVVVVSRTSSPFGKGWWIEGLESLVSAGADAMLWIGGDGSSRLYKRAADASIYTVSPTYDRPDSLLRDVSAGTWRRRLSDGAYVEFNNAGQHTSTVNALGWTTSFAYSGTLLESITLPVPEGSSEIRRYRFWYSSSKLDSIQAPTASFARTTRLNRNTSSQITSITDPDGYATAFGYDPSNKITWRRNKLNDTNHFSYDLAGALKESILDMSRTDGAGSQIVTSFRAAETRGAFDESDVPAPLAVAYTHIDGPRTDVADTTTFMVNRFGAVDTVTNALGQRTRVERSNASFPALVTRMIVPNGFETRAFFNSRGLADSTVAVNPYGTGSNATTKFAWNPVWNQVDSMIGPTGDRTRTFFRSSRAIPDSMRTGTNASRRVAFSYTSDNQLRSVKEADGGPDSVAYDALGNTIKAYSPVGRAASAPYFSEFLKDALGRDTLVISGDTTSSTHFVYDVADRIVRTLVNGPSRPYTLPLNASFQPDTAAVVALMRTDTTGYDVEGNLTYKRSIAEPGYDSQLNEQMTYDAAGRLKSRRVGSGPDSLVYDPAGNVVSAKQRSGAWVTQSYDALNRLTRRIVPAVTHPSSPCSQFLTGPLSGAPCQMVFPFYPNSGSDLLIPADTSRFTYDNSGNMLTANNRYARIRRTYLPAGAVESDTTIIGTLASPLVDGEKKGQKYSYDLAGRRTSMLWEVGPTSYSYTDFGALASITDASSNTYRFKYDLKGRLDSLLLGSGVREKREYDDDGRLVFKNRVSDYSGVGLLVTDSLRYDKADRIVRAWQEAHSQSADQTLISYDGLGAVVAREQGNQFGSNVEEFRNDAFGNMIRKMNRRSAGLVNTAPFTLSYNVKSELTAWNTTLSSSSGQYDREDNLSQSFLNGRLERQSEIIRDPNSGDVSLQVASRHYYGSDDRLMTVQRYSYKGPSLRDGTWEEYWYDALGRRVLTRTRRPGTTSQPLCVSPSAPSVCSSFTERVWWDGDQSLVEARTAEGTSDVSNSGTVGNINALTLDEPIAVITTNPTTETRIINYNWRGQGMSSVFPNGQGADYVTGNAVAEVGWPAMTQAQTYFTPSLDATTTSNTAKKWLGTFVQNGMGTTGMLYRRNRYFDANTGRFTQEDPIGIAGSVNQYGFAAGDPINFSDPYGLRGCPEGWLDDGRGFCYNPVAALGMAIGGAFASSEGFKIFAGLRRAIVSVSESPYLANLASKFESLSGAKPSLTQAPISRAEQAMQKQFDISGRASVEKTIRNLTGRIADHEADIIKYRELGGHVSSMEREVRAWKETIDAARKILEKN